MGVGKIALRLLFGNIIKLVMLNKQKDIEFTKLKV
jgi:hypothetical protein